MVQHVTRRWVVGGLGGLVVSGALAGCSAPSDEGDDGSGTDGSRTTVELTDELVFDPGQVNIAVGDTVSWRNVGSVNHSVTAYADGIPDGVVYFASGGFDSEQAARDAYPDGSVGGGDRFEHTFETAGTYEYFCIPHEGTGMTGTVEVG